MAKIGKRITEMIYELRKVSGLDKFKDHSLLGVSEGRLKCDWCSKSLHGEKMIGAKRPLTLQKKT